ncbi:potassium transporter TrkA [Micromonospora sp. CB01531]|uniref:potassium transporter TrkA n=1 Tax=Micromonospora sp. CB01531 TaxID=1718947 RepID=UPI00093B279A|nr:potassium transporter TrkA [Micromonospora sp. CB01531]OKI85205.1 potassium transporter TrkA [Micromonospora sp. CB01531]
MSAPLGNAPRHVVVVGSGQLARSLCDSLASIHTPQRVRVTVLARDLTAALGAARGAQVRATVAGTGVSFTAEPFTAESSTDPGDGYAADAVSMARLRPDVLVCAASAQSPYERVHAPSAWTELVATAGFGVTLALQAELVSRLAAALAGGAPDALLVNGCFPDAVNPLLTALNLPVLCGIGNVATLAACLDAALGRPGPRRLAVLGHHAHLAAPGPNSLGDDAAEVRAWLDGLPVPDVTRLLAGYRALPRPELNALAGHAAAALVAGLAADADEVMANLPGPLGLPGGYPVRLSGGRAELRLPSEVSTAQAVAWNTAAGHRDGVEVSDGHVRYPERARAALSAYQPELAEGWPVTELPEVFARFIALRDHLRTAPPTPAQASRVLEESRCP